MSADDEAYDQKRAEEEIERARRSTDPRAVQLHYRLSELYLDRLHGPAGAASGRPGR